MLIIYIGKYGKIEVLYKERSKINYDLSIFYYFFFILFIDGLMISFVGVIVCLRGGWIVGCI